jgi:hypothetical protein
MHTRWDVPTPEGRDSKRPVGWRVEYMFLRGLLGVVEDAILSILASNDEQEEQTGMDKKKQMEMMRA